MKTEDIDKMFDEGKSLLPVARLDTLRRPGLSRAPRRINIDIPEWVVHQLDDVAEHIGVTRQSLIKMWLVDRLNVHRQSSSRPPNNLDTQS
jgi:hypothetical protein